MAYTINGLVSGASLSEIHTTKMYDLGTEVDIVDPTYGTGRAIYLPGVASLAVGSAVIYSATAGTSALTNTGATATSRGKLAISFTANTSATNYSWFLIKGAISTKAGTIAAANTGVYMSGTAGTLDDSGATQKVQGAIWKGTDSGGFALAEFNNPFATGDS